MRVPEGLLRTPVSQVRYVGDRNHHQASREFQYPITPGMGDPCWDSQSPPVVYHRIGDSRQAWRASAAHCCRRLFRQQCVGVHAHRLFAMFCASEAASYHAQ
jgi:hypothetical protein